MKSVFIFRENVYQIRYFQITANENKNTLRYGLETICYRAPFLWTNLPEECKPQNPL